MPLLFALLLLNYLSVLFFGVRYYCSTVKQSLTSHTWCFPAIIISWLLKSYSVDSLSRSSISIITKKLWYKGWFKSNNWNVSSFTNSLPSKNDMHIVADLISPHLWILVLKNCKSLLVLFLESPKWNFSWWLFCKYIRSKRWLKPSSVILVSCTLIFFSGISICPQLETTSKYPTSTFILIHYASAFS